MTEVQEEYEILANHNSDLLTQDLVFTGIYKYTNFKEFGLSFDFPHISYDQRTGDIGWGKKQVEEIRSNLLSEEQYQDLIDSLKETRKNFRAYLELFEKKLHLARENPEIIQEFFDQATRATKSISRHILELAISEEIEKRNLPPEAIKSSKTETTEALEELKSIAEEFSEELRLTKQEDYTLSPRLTLRLNNFCQKYGYLGMKYFKGRPWNLWDIFEMLKEVDLTEKNDKSEKEKVDYDCHYLKFAEELLCLRTQKWEIMCYGCYLFRKMVIKYFSDIVDYNDLLNLKVSEVINVLSGKFYPKEIVHNRENFILKLEDEGLRLIIDLKEDQKLEEDKEVLEVRGQVACPGKVVGRAKVILSPEENSKVEKGDVVIATMSTPDFLPAMNKAAAFVTNVGGMTCHAAIVSREMCKPCVIGTKNATKVFKDGDLVEVDANLGTVKKIKGAKNSTEMKLPTKQECLELFDKYKVPLDIKRHCLKVQEVAVLLAQKLKAEGVDINTELVSCTALLHDLFKMVVVDPTKKTRFHVNNFTPEEIEMGQQLKEKYSQHKENDIAYEVFKDDYPELALTLLRTTDLKVKKDKWEELVVCYADCRTQRTTLVDLQYRFDYAIEQYPRPPGVWEQRLQELQEYESKLFSQINLKPAQLTEEINKEPQQMT